MSTHSSGRLPAGITMLPVVAFMLAAAEPDPPASEKPGWEWVSSQDQPIAVLHGHEDQVNSVAFSPDGSRIASGSRDKTVRLWDANNGRARAVLRGHEDSVSSVAFSPDGSRLASASSDGTVRLWDVASGKEILVIHAHKSPVWAVAFSPDGSRIASGSKDKTVRLWDVSAITADKGKGSSP